MSQGSSGAVVELRRRPTGGQLLARDRVLMRWVLLTILCGHLVVNLLMAGGSAARFELDYVVCNCAYLTAAVATGWRSRVSRRERWPWRLLTVALLVSLVGNVLGVYMRAATYQLPADVLRLAWYALSIAAIAALTVNRRRTSATAWLDGLTAGLGAGAVASVFVFRHLVEPTTPSWTAAGNMAHRAAEVTLVVLLVALGYAVRGKDRSWWLLAMAFAAVFVGDLIMLDQSGAGTWDLAGRFGSVWPAAATVIGIAACSSTSARWRRPRAKRIVVPSAFALLAAAVLIVGLIRSVPPVAVVLAAAAVVSASLRVVATIREARSVAAAGNEHRVVYLRSLSNRWALVEHVDDCVRDESRR